MFRAKCSRFGACIPYFEPASLGLYILRCILLSIQATRQMLKFGIQDSKRSLRNHNLAVLLTHYTAPRHESRPAGERRHFIHGKALPFGPSRYSWSLQSQRRVPESACPWMLDAERREEAAPKSKSPPPRTLSLAAEITASFIPRQYRS
jgi:hypothetical protein